MSNDKKLHRQISTGTNETERENTCLFLNIDFWFFSVFQDVFSLSSSPKRFNCDGERQAKKQREFLVAPCAAPEFNVDCTILFSFNQNQKLWNHKTLKQNKTKSQGAPLNKEKNRHVLMLSQTVSNFTLYLEHLAQKILMMIANIIADFLDWEKITECFTLNIRYCIRSFLVWRKFYGLAERLVSSW